MSDSRPVHRRNEEDEHKARTCRTQIKGGFRNGNMGMGPAGGQDMEGSVRQ